MVSHSASLCEERIRWKTCTGYLLVRGHFASTQLGAWKQIKGVSIVGLVNRTAEMGRIVALEFGIIRDKRWP